MRLEVFSMNLLAELKKNPFVLAPMAGITDVAFRSFMKEMGTGIVVTELVSANGLEHESRKTRELMKIEEFQRPVGIQLFGDDSTIIARAAQLAEQEGADFVDLNFGCPVPKVVKRGAGSAVLKDLVTLAKILKDVRAAVKIPVTIKIRTGWDESSKNATEVSRIAFEEGITWVAIHGRTRAAGYSGLADWDYISEVKAASKIPIIGNGDILTAEEANEKLRFSNCDGVMIGRGCLKNPWIFHESLSVFNGGNALISEKNFCHVFERLEWHLTRHYDPVRVMLHLKKFSAWFSAGYPGSATFRRNIFETKDLESVISSIKNFYGGIASSQQGDTRGDGFLMGGHG